MSRKEAWMQQRWRRGQRVLRWFDARERNALLALLAAAVLLILCSLAAGTTSTSALAAELPTLKGQAVRAP